MTEDLYLEQLKLGPMENFVYIIGSKSTREVALSFVTTSPTKGLKTFFYFGNPLPP